MMKKFGFHTFAGYTAALQPGDTPDVLLHERVAAWTKEWMAKHSVRKSDNLDVMEERLHERLRECASYINPNYNAASV